MLDFGDPRLPVDPAVFRARGGFVWWYLDLIDEAGDGLVLIWAWGLPFLPGYADRSRRGVAECPADRPCLNLAVYQGGRQSFYLLQEYAPSEVSYSHEECRFGNSRIVSTLRDGERFVRATLDCPVPGSRSHLTGRIELRGREPAFGGEVPTLSDGRHLWTPLSVQAEAWADLESGKGFRFRTAGRGYHDRNASVLPLDAVGVGFWAWGRVSLPQEERVFYCSWPSDEGRAPIHVGVRSPRGAGAGERFTGLSVTGTERRGRFGMTSWSSATLSRDGSRWLTLRFEPPLDDGPFYVRCRVFGVDDCGERGSGWAEFCRPDRVDLRRHRPLVRMRVHRTSGNNSMFLPLFSGTGPRDLRRWFPFLRKDGER